MRSKEVIGGIIIAVLSGAALLPLTSAYAWFTNIVSASVDHDDIVFNSQWQLSNTLSPNSFQLNCTFGYDLALEIANLADRPAKIEIEGWMLPFAVPDAKYGAALYGMTNSITAFNSIEALELGVGGVMLERQVALLSGQKLYLSLDLDVRLSEQTEKLVEVDCRPEDRKAILASALGGGLPEREMFLLVKANGKTTRRNFVSPLLYNGLVLKYK